MQPFIFHRGRDPEPRSDSMPPHFPENPGRGSTEWEREGMFENRDQQSAVALFFEQVERMLQSDAAIHQRAKYRMIGRPPAIRGGRIEHLLRPSPRQTGGEAAVSWFLYRE